MSDLSSFSSTVGGRYATALFELALEEGELDRVESDMAALGEALTASADLMRLIRSPLYSREEQRAAILAVADAMGLSRLMRNMLGLMAERRRLFVLPETVKIFARLAAEHRGEVSAEVTAARPLSEAQREALARTLREAIGREVRLQLAVDEDLIGGLVVKVGSRMVDSSIRSRLAALKRAMKEVG